MVFIDTAGQASRRRGPMMEELARHERPLADPTEILLVVDAMTGQDAVNVAEAFNNQARHHGRYPLPKLDGDTRGGAASVRCVMSPGKPIKFIGVQAKSSTLIEPFYPDRMASRILGMGDVLSLIEKAEQTFDDEAGGTELEKKLREDFLHS